MLAKFDFMAHGQSMRKPLYPDASHAYPSTTNNNVTAVSLNIVSIPVACSCCRFRDIFACRVQDAFSSSCRQANSDVSCRACISREELALSRLPCRSCHVVREGWPHSSSPVVVHLQESRYATNRGEKIWTCLAMYGPFLSAIAHA